MLQITSIKRLLSVSRQTVTFSNLKASNMMHDTDGTVKISDYQYSIFTHYLEKLIDPELLDDGRLLWFAPEIIFDQQYDKKADIWGFGCLTLELLTGKPPFYEETEKGLKYKLIKILKKQSKASLIINRTTKIPSKPLTSMHQLFKSLLQI